MHLRRVDGMFFVMQGGTKTTSFFSFSCSSSSSSHFPNTSLFTTQCPHLSSTPAIYTIYTHIALLYTHIHSTLRVHHTLAILHTQLSTIFHSQPALSSHAIHQLIFPYSIHTFIHKIPLSISTSSPLPYPHSLFFALQLITHHPKVASYSAFVSRACRRRLDATHPQESMDGDIKDKRRR